MEITWIDNVCVCDNCGSHAANEDDIIHHSTCKLGESKKWEEFYEEQESWEPET